MNEHADTYESRVTATLDRTLPPHTADCDEAWTTGRCLRCDVMASMQVTFGFARPLRHSEDHAAPLDVEAAKREALTVERLARALYAEDVVSGVGGRFGKFNDAYYEAMAARLLAALAGSE